MSGPELTRSEDRALQLAYGISVVLLALATEFPPLLGAGALALLGIPAQRRGWRLPALAEGAIAIGAAAGGFALGFGTGDGTLGLYIHPNIWHEGVFPLSPQATFHDEQGKVHARVSCNIAREFDVFLAIPLQSPPT